MIPTVASLGNNINYNNKSKNFLNAKKVKNPSPDIINLHNNNINSQNIYGVKQIKNKVINSSKVKPFKNDLIINNNNIINQNYNNINNIYTNKFPCSNINNNNNQGNLINLNGINISYSELAKHLHSRKNISTNNKAKNSKEKSVEKMHSSLKKINNFKQPSSFKILSMQNETNDNSKENQNNKEKQSEKESTPEKNILLLRDCFFNNSFKRKKRNVSLKYNFPLGFNNISQFFKNSSSNLNTSNSISNINAANLGGSYSFANNSKTTKENSILNSMANTMKGSNFFNFLYNNSFVNSSCNNLYNKSSINFNHGNTGQNRNAFSKSNFLNNLNNNMLCHNDSIKCLNFGRTNNPSEIEGPELLHFFYVNILQQNKKLAFKFENCEQENSFILNENETNAFA